MSIDIRSRNTIFRRLPVEQAVSNYRGGRHRLRLVYKTRDLIVLGLGVMIGAGIFNIAGELAAGEAGPSVILSFGIAAIVCLMCALCYAELSSTLPVAGSAYSFTYVAFGEVWAWIIGWAVLLELQLAAAYVARAWSLYVVQLVNDTREVSGRDWIKLPSALTDITGQTAGFELFSLLILAILGVVVATGMRLSLYTLWFMVLAKVMVIGFIVAGGIQFFDSGNLKPFVPEGQDTPSGGDSTVLDVILGGGAQNFGILGIFVATSAIAFAYIGFDLIATAAEETEDAPRRVPRGMLASLLIATVLYVLVAVTLVGMVSYKEIDPGTPLASAFKEVGADSMSLVIDIGAVIGLTTVILVVMVAQTRIIFAMARDGLLPRSLAAISHRYHVPTRAAILVAITALVLSQIDVWTFDRVRVLDDLGEMVVIGTLAAFVFVCGGVIALRSSRPDLERGFRVPGGSVTAFFAILATCWLLLNLQVKTWAWFGIWMLAGVVIYLIYGRNHSHLREILGGRPRRIPGRHERIR